MWLAKVVFYSTLTFLFGYYFQGVAQAQQPHPFRIAIGKTTPLLAAKQFRIVIAVKLPFKKPVVLVSANEQIKLPIFSPIKTQNIFLLISKYYIPGRTFYIASKKNPKTPLSNTLVIAQTVAPTATPVAPTTTATPVASPTSIPHVTPSVTPEVVALPMELLWNHPQKESSITLTAGDAANAKYFTARIHNIDGEDHVKFCINEDCVNVKNDTVETKGLGEGYGDLNQIGIGTRDIRYTLKPGTLKPGLNKITFLYNGVVVDLHSLHRFSDAYRVIAWNFKTSNGTNIIPESTFHFEDPSLWNTNYSQEAKDRGEILWKTAKLAANPYSKVFLKVSCQDCHTKTGWDLKYFNYSPESIISRAQFHKLSEENGRDINAYIRSLSVAVPKSARPWSPLYQPGPGIDSKPVHEWAAGAGLDAVLKEDKDAIPQIFPDGDISAEKISLLTGKTLNMREFRVPFQYPSWNEWLPKVHPTDTNPAVNDSVLQVDGQFERGNAYRLYSAARRGLGVKGSAESENYIKSGGLRSDLTLMYQEADNSAEALRSAGLVWTTADALAVYSIRLWQLKEIFDIMHEYDLEGRNQEFYGPNADPRGWPVGAPFATIPTANNRPGGDGGLLGMADPKSNRPLLAHIWYNLAEVVSFWNKPEAGYLDGHWSGNSGIDGRYYVDALAGSMSVFTGPNGVQAYAAVLRMMQERARYGFGVLSDAPYAPHWGQSPQFIFTNLDQQRVFGSLPVEIKNKLAFAIFGAHYKFLMQVPVADFLTAGQVKNPPELLTPQWNETFLARIRRDIAYLHLTDPTSTLPMEIAEWADKNWPGYSFKQIALGNGAMFINIAPAKKGVPAINPSNGKLEDTYFNPGNPSTFSPGEEIFLRGWMQQAETAVYQRSWYEIDGVEQHTFTPDEGTVMFNAATVQGARGYAFTINNIGTHLVDVKCETTKGIVSGMRYVVNISNSLSPQSMRTESLQSNVSNTSAEKEETSGYDSGVRTSKHENSVHSEY